VEAEWDDLFPWNARVHDAVRGYPAQNGKGAAMATTDDDLRAKCVHLR
jgi:hypothetical protein